jgi:HAD superfamily hydrolase (TIGR01509 family)
LVHDPEHEWWVTNALARVGRSASQATVRSLCDQLRDAARLPEVIDGEATADCSAELHRSWSMLHFRAAGLDDELAEALYDLDFDPPSHPFYPDVAPTLRSLHERGCRVALVSNIHFDVRPEFVAAGLFDLIDTFVLSFEHGVQKPGREIFETALHALGISAHEAILVGDSASLDGGAVAVGIETLLLPAQSSPDSTRGLADVLLLIR